MDLTGFESVAWDLNKFQLIGPESNQFEWIWPNSNNLRWIGSDSNNSQRIWPDSNQFQWIWPGLNRFGWILTCSNRFWWIWPGWTRRTMVQSLNFSFEPIQPDEKNQFVDNPTWTYRSISCFRGPVGPSDRGFFPVRGWDERFQKPCCGCRAGMRRRDHWLRPAYSWAQCWCVPGVRNVSAVLWRLCWPT